jgi:hypothetical protein
MIFLRLVLAMAFATFAASGQQTLANPPQVEAVPDSCPVAHRPATPFMPSSPPFREAAAQLAPPVFLIGSDKLFTSISDPMVWEWRRHQPGHEQEVQPLTAKIFWFRLGYDYRTEPQPDLKVSGKRLDGPAPPLLTFDHATNAIMGNVGSMLTGVYVPTPGCWEITGDYKGVKLSFVVWLAAPKPVQ